MPTTHYLWDFANDSYLMEMDGNSDTTAVYTNEPVQYGNLISQQRTGTTSYYHFDGQGSTRQITNQDEAVTDMYTHSGFGELVTASGLTINHFQFVGKVGYYFELENSQYYVRARTYDVAAGRWTSEDPAGPTTTQQFVYSLNAPINRQDPSGELCLASCKQAGGRPIDYDQLADDDPDLQKLKQKMRNDCEKHSKKEGGGWSLKECGPYRYDKTSKKFFNHYYCVKCEGECLKLSDKCQFDCEWDDRKVAVQKADCKCLPVVRL